MNLHKLAPKLKTEPSNESRAWLGWASSTRFKRLRRASLSSNHNTAEVITGDWKRGNRKLKYELSGGVRDCVEVKESLIRALGYSGRRRGYFEIMGLMIF
ncbi:hypothetical protein V6N13_088058 [Hibiscus sabdariffa]|uniref:Uncharacterized protein n=1 Tax=Hibiscus sabdariffa TaxID=183260 RepID=A0ABR2FY44_9ROSI